MSPHRQRVAGALVSTVLVLAGARAMTNEEPAPPAPAPANPAAVAAHHIDRAAALVADAAQTITTEEQDQ